MMPLLLSLAALGAAAPGDDQPDAPHTPTLSFYLSAADSASDVKAIQSCIQKLKSASVVEVNTAHSYARIRFDSHVVSYHQIAQAISDAGESLGKNYDPRLIFTVSDYAKPANAPRVNTIFAGKRLNQRVHVKPLDPAKGIFVIHFLPLKVDPTVTAPQGFNGGHLHHPISDPPPRGLGLISGYASDYDPAISEELQTVSPSSRP